MSSHIFATGCVKDWATRNMALVPVLSTYLSSFWKFSTYPNKIGLILGFHQKFYWPPGSFNILMQPLILLYNIMDLNPI